MQKTTIHGLDKFEKRMRNIFKAPKETIKDVVMQVRKLNEGKEFVVSSIWNRSANMFKRDGKFAIIGNAEVHLDYYDEKWNAFFTVKERK